MANTDPRRPIAICPHCRQVVKAMPLTHTQWEVARRLINGATTTEIAEEICVSIKTVEAHRAKIFLVLGVKNVAHLIRWAHDRGILGLMNWPVPQEVS